MAERIETTITHCDGCQNTHIGCFPLHPAQLPKICAMLGPDGCYVLALCANCYSPLADQLKNEITSEPEPLMGPELGTWAFTARLMAECCPVDDDPDYWDRWKDEMKERDL